MLHFDCADQIRNAPSGDGLKNGVFRNTARADSARAAKQASLHGVTSNLAGYATRPPDCWLVEAFALEPIGIAASGVHIPKLAMLGEHFRVRPCWTVLFL